MKIGFFGGCFNPPTNAHINLAKKVLDECDIDKVIFVPVGDFYNKKELVSEKHRYNMLKIACDGIKHLEVSDIELNLKERLYATDAFELIEKEYQDSEKFFIMGADNFINILSWKNSKSLVEKYNYIVLDRYNIDLDEYIDKNIKKEKIQIIKNDDYMRYNSTEFRNNLKKNNEYNQEIVSDEVIDYIIENGLYK